MRMIPFASSNSLRRGRAGGLWLLVGMMFAALPAYSLPVISFAWALRTGATGDVTADAIWAAKMPAREKWWSFHLIQNPAPPTVSGDSRNSRPVDRLILLPVPSLQMEGACLQERLPDGVRVIFLTPRREPTERAKLGDFDPKRPTRLIVYATPNGNTVEQTLGGTMTPSADWHYDIQHIAAQTRLLQKQQKQQEQREQREQREHRKDENIVLACVEAEGLSWPAWRQKHPDNPAYIRALVEGWRKRFASTAGIRVTLTGHSGGGSFLWGYLNGGETIPDYVDRIAFLDANYSYSDEDHHGEKLMAWLEKSRLNHLVVLAYDDRNITLNGKPVVGPTGGTYRATERMRAAFGKRISLTETTIQANGDNVLRYEAMQGQCLFMVHTNPANKILHTALVGDMNGYLMAMTHDTPEPIKPIWGTFGGPRAYTEWIRPIIDAPAQVSAPGETPPKTSHPTLPPRP